MATRRKPAAEAATIAPQVHETLNQALLAIQAGMPAFQRDGVNPHFGSRYLSLESLLPQLTEILNAHGVLLTQLPTAIGEVPALLTRLTHVATGETLESTCPLSAGKETPQAQGSAITYLRRYMVSAIFTIVADRDDDGNAGSRVAQVVETVSAGGAVQGAPVVVQPSADGLAPAGLGQSL